MVNEVRKIKQAHSKCCVLVLSPRIRRMPRIVLSLNPQVHCSIICIRCLMRLTDLLKLVLLIPLDTSGRFYLLWFRCTYRMCSDRVLYSVVLRCHPCSYFVTPIIFVNIPFTFCIFTKFVLGIIVRIPSFTNFFMKFWIPFVEKFHPYNATT